MEYIQERLGRGINEVNVLYLGDCHYGNPNYKESVVDNALEEITSKKVKESYIYLMSSGQFIKVF